MISPILPHHGSGRACVGQDHVGAHVFALFEIGGDDVVVSLEHALERHIERIGAVERDRTIEKQT